MVLFDVRLGEVLGRIALEDSLGTITSVGFRSDDEAQTLAVATSAGHLVFFDLTNKLRLLHITRNAHDGAVAGMQYVAGEGVLFTNSGDNSVKVRSQSLSYLTAVLMCLCSNGYSTLLLHLLDFSNRGPDTVRLSAS